MPETLRTYIIARYDPTHHPTAIKIGKSSDPARRLAGLQTGCPDPLELIVTLEGDHEDELHTRFASQRGSGEWFTLSAELTDPLWTFAQEERSFTEPTRLAIISYLHGHVLQIGEEDKLLCPVCDVQASGFQHFQAPEIVPGYDAYGAVTQGVGRRFRGSAIRIPMRGECGHRWSLVVGFDRGRVVLQAGPAQRKDQEGEELR